MLELELELVLVLVQVLLILLVLLVLLVLLAQLVPYLPLQPWLASGYLSRFNLNNTTNTQGLGLRMGLRAGLGQK